MEGVDFECLLCVLYIMDACGVSWKNFEVRTYIPSVEAFFCKLKWKMDVFIGSSKAICHQLAFRIPSLAPSVKLQLERLLDACGATMRMFSQMKQCLKELESSILRKRGESGFASDGKDTTLEALTREAEEMSVAVFASLLSSISLTTKSKGSGSCFMDFSGLLWLFYKLLEILAPLQPQSHHHSRNCSNCSNITSQINEKLNHQHSSMESTRHFSSELKNHWVSRTTHSQRHFASTSTPSLTHRTANSMKLGNSTTCMQQIKNQSHALKRTDLIQEKSFIPDYLHADIAPQFEHGHILALKTQPLLALQLFSRHRQTNFSTMVVSERLYKPHGSYGSSPSSAHMSHRPFVNRPWPFKTIGNTHCPAHSNATIQMSNLRSMGHIAKTCPQFARLKSQPIVLSMTEMATDSAASHNMTGDLANLTIHSEYDGTDEVVIGDGTGLTVSHVGSLTLDSPLRTFVLNNTLCVPNISKNLISVHNFTSQNNVLLNFTILFLVKTQFRRRFAKRCM
uniref:Retrovirus-related Pol polyprotein from transposon TNT 1-94-like beta-barrel domain-containing protein n=1 Tax=Salix viminalis TaxID=40686 RepID=A0A6N2KGW5_SALVM